MESRTASRRLHSPSDFLSRLGGFLPRLGGFLPRLGGFFLAVNGVDGEATLSHAFSSPALSLTLGFPSRLTATRHSAAIVGGLDLPRARLLGGSLPRRWWLPLPPRLHSNLYLSPSALCFPSRFPASLSLSVLWGFDKQ